MNPIGVVVKANRFGLGREAVLKEIREQKEQFRIRKWRQQKESEMTPDEYRFVQILSCWYYTVDRLVCVTRSKTSICTKQ